MACHGSLVLDEEKITLNGMAVSGWKPRSVTRTATNNSIEKVPGSILLMNIRHWISYKNSLGKDIVDG